LDNAHYLDHARKAMSTNNDRLIDRRFES
jgi:hypothetical protein